MKRVYVAGPYSSDNVVGVFANMREGMELSFQVLNAGFAPFCPWLNDRFFLMDREGELTVPRMYAYSMAWLEVSDCMLLQTKDNLYLDSTGTKKEIVRAEQLGIPIYYTLNSLIIHEGPNAGPLKRRLR